MRAILKLKIGVLTLALAAAASAETPKLQITLANNNDLEQRKKDQIERLAAQYDLKKYTLTKEIRIEQGATNHSKPVLTLNPGFLYNDDRALSAYVHEQGHWVLLDHQPELRSLYQDLVRNFPSIPANPPEGSGSLQDSYFHLAVIMLEWQALDQLIGPERARAVLDFKQTDHYTALYKTVLENRTKMEDILKRHGVGW